MKQTIPQIKQLLKKLIAFRSYPTSETNDQSAILDFVLDYCAQAEMTVKKVDNMVGWAQIGEKGPLIAFPVHLDVVPPGEGWSVPPFELTEDEYFYYGRGIYDNKGPAAIMLELVKELREEILQHNIRVRLIFGNQEETGMNCIKSYVEQEEMPVGGFVPDALFPVVLGEKGRLHIQLTTSEQIPWLKKLTAGEQVNSVIDYAEFELTEAIALDIANLSSKTKRIFYAQGMSAHGSKPEAGKNALYLLLKSIFVQNRTPIIQQLLLLDTPTFNGESIGISAPDQIFGDTTVNVGVVDYRQGKWRVELDIRYGKNSSQSEILSKLQIAYPTTNIKVISAKPCHLVEKTELVDRLVENYRQFYPEENQTPIYMGGGTYASYFPGFISYGPKLPSVRTFAHGKDERMQKDVFIQTIEIYRRAIKIVIQTYTHRGEEDEKN